MINVVNKRHHNAGVADYYIGRPSPLGNPYHVSPTTNREESIWLYEQWLHAKIHANDLRVMYALNEILSIEKRHGRVNLVCFCAPLYCHGDVLKGELEKIKKEIGMLLG